MHSGRRRNALRFQPFRTCLSALRSHAERVCTRCYASITRNVNFRRRYRKYNSHRWPLVLSRNAGVLEAQREKRKKKNKGMYLSLRLFQIRRCVVAPCRTRVTSEIKFSAIIIVGVERNARIRDQSRRRVND